ncbi:MAG: recombinase family protein [Oligoflexia bacterium]|nr:recombinase family protein [Oligoflexia bacterium]
MDNVIKINDLSRSPLKEKYFNKEFKPQTNYAVCMSRVSTKKQKDSGQSDDAQSERIAEYTKKQNLNVVREWDVAETAFKHDKRKNFKEMLEFVKTNPHIKHIIFSHQSRSNRNRDSARELDWLIRHNGVVIHCVRDNLILHAQSPLEDWLRWDIFNNLNEKSSEDHKKNVMDGTIKRLEMGLFPGKAPAGYKNFRLDNGLSIFVIDQEHAPWVKLAFEMFATGLYSIERLTKQLLSEFKANRRLRDMSGRSKHMEEILKNEFYYGDFVYIDTLYHGHPEYHPRLISYDLWAKAQDAFKKRGKNKMSKLFLPYIGLIRCVGKILDENGQETDEECGCSLTGEIKSKKLKDGTITHYNYWHCSNTTRRCSQRDKEFMYARNLKPYYSQSHLEEMLEKIFIPLHFTEEVCKWMQAVLLKEHKNKSKENEIRITTLNQRLSRITKFIGQAYEDKLLGNLPEDIWKKNNREWMLEQEQIKQELASICDDNHEYIEKGAHLIELARNTIKTYRSANSETKRKLVEIISSNHILVNGSIGYDYKKPFDVLAKMDDVGKWWTVQGSSALKNYLIILTF